MIDTSCATCVHCNKLILPKGKQEEIGDVYYCMAQGKAILLKNDKGFCMLWYGMEEKKDGESEVM